MELDNILQGVEDGTISHLTAYARLKVVEKQVKAAITSLQEDAVGEAEKYGEKSFKAHGFVFELRQGPRRWDFKGLPAWAEKKQELADVEATARAAYSAYEKGLISASSDGEEVVLPKVTFAKSSIVVKW